MLLLAHQRLLAPAIATLLLCVHPASTSAHGDFEQRIQAADRAVAADPGDPAPRLVRAELHRRHGDFGAALQDLDTAGGASPAPHNVAYFRGLVYLDAGRYAEAEATLRRFLDREPEHPAGHEARARALLGLEQHLAAARAYDRVIALQPVPIPEHYHARAQSLAAAGDAHLDEAIRGVDEGIAALGPVVSLERIAIDLELRRGATEAALLRVDRIAARAPRRELWLAQRGDILAGAGRTEEAEQSFALALTELHRLSGSRRSAPATSRLEAEIRASMARLSSSEPRGTP